MYLDRRLWGLTAGVRLRIVAAAGLGLLGVAAGTARLALLGWLLARVLQGAPVGTVVGPAALVACLIGLRAWLEYARTMLAHATAARVQARLRARLYQQVTRLGPAHFARERTGDAMLALVEGVQQLEVYFGQYLPQLLVAAATPPLIFVAVSVVDRPVALVLLVAALVTLVAPSAWHRLDSQQSLERQRAYGTFAAEFLDALQGLATLKAFGQGAARAARLDRQGWALLRRTMGVLGTNTLARGITDTGLAIGAAAALAVGAFRVRAGDMTLDALVVVLMLGVEVFRPLRDLRVLLHQGMLGRAAAEGILGLLGAAPAVLDRPGPAAGLAPQPGDTGTLAALPATVAFEDVTFAYPGGRAPALQGLRFALAAGERVAIVGPSGSGKSTITRLLLRFHDPQAGRVLVGGRDARELGLDQLRSRIAVVNQDTYLFHGTVEDNLRMGRPDASAAALEAAARAANAHDFIAALPDGYRTQVGERGVRLSGGQRQRIAIARALLRDAPILVLDEALSSVDAASEALIQPALDRLMAGRTTLVCAHRLSSVIGADRVLVLEGGRLVESGRHAELMTRRGAYHRLMAGQALADDGGPRPVTASPPGPTDGRDAARAPAAGGARLEPGAPGGPRPAGEPAHDAILAAAGPGARAVLRFLLTLSRRHHPRLTATFLLGVARVAALLGVGVASALAVRALARGEPFAGWLIALGAVAPLAGILHWLESWLAHDVAYRLLHDLRMSLFQKLEALAPAYLVRRRSGDLVGLATHDVELIEYFFAHTITPVAVAVLVPAAVLATLAAHRWELAAVLAPGLAWGALGPLVRRGAIDRLGARAREASGELNAHAVDTIQGLAEILAFQHVGPRGEELARRAQAYVAARLPFLRDLARETALGDAVTALGGLAVAGTGALLVARGGLEAGTLPLLTLLAMSAFLPIWEVAQTGRQLADTFAAARRLRAVYEEPVPVTDGPGVGAAPADGAPGPADPMAIELAGVGFRYPGRERPALDGVSFRVQRGSRVALVGPSGAGKTTVAHLLLRFWDPDTGTVRLEGRDLRDHRLAEARARIALVAQDTYLFNDTLRANVLLARPDATEAALRAAVARAALDELVAALPDGLETVVGERGAQLSGGQRQRVAIARAFLKDAPILVLDEATSHLDAVSERIVHDALDRLARGRTTLVIAHRLSTIRDADQIVVLDEGRVAETGSHRALLGRGGLYARLVHRQVAARPEGGDLPTRSEPAGP